MQTVRDTETGNDDFGARYYSNRFGRWLSADWSNVPVPVPYANLTNPQTLNLYSMVADDPESFADLDGHADCCDIWDAINFVVGFANAYGSDNWAGAGRMKQSTTAGKIGAAVGDTAATAQGATEATLGAGGEVLGVSLDATGVGAVVGVPVNVVSAVAVVHGATVATEGAGHLGAAAADAIDNALNKPSESRSSGPKAADAPGVTAGGQATDKYGNKRGPSGEKPINKTSSNTREAARNKALKQGSGAVEHRNPAQGKPHFHPTTKKGEKQSSSTHNEYPD